jgi:hypothetical protein
MPCCSMQIAGDPRTVRARIEEFADQTAADEIKVTTNVYEHAERATTKGSPGSSSSSGRRPAPCAARKERE